MIAENVRKRSGVPTLVVVLLATGVLGAASLFEPSAVRAQLRPEFELSAGVVAPLGGDAWSGFEESIGLGAAVGAELGSGWRASLGGGWSEHDRQTGLGIPGTYGDSAAG